MAVTTTTQPTINVKDVIASEKAKCIADCSYFMRDYCKIQHPTRGKIDFKLWDFQKDVLDQLQTNDLNIILKARQLGLSTLVAGYCLWLLLFHDDKTALIIAINQEVSKNLVSKIRYMHSNLPSWLRGNCVEDNKLSLHFANGSSVKAATSTENAGRSEALSMLIIDEAAFIDSAEEIWTSAFSTLSTGGKGIMLSTPNGVGNFFHKKWVEAESGTVLEHQFNTIKLHWSLHPEHHQDWRDRQTVQLGDRKAAQECDCSFITSGYTVIDGEIIEWYKGNKMVTPVERRGIGGEIWIWDYPDYTKTYILSADIARGDGADFSTFHIIEAESLTQCVEFRGKISTTEFGHMIVNMATEYNNALLVVENVGIGWAVIQTCIDRNYPNLLYTSANLEYMDTGTQLTKGYDLKRNDELKPGISTNVRLRPLLISKLEEYFRERIPNIKSIRLVEEMFVFVWQNGKAQARHGYNDDLVLAFCMALWTRDTALKMRMEGIELTKNAVNNIQKYDGAYTANADMKQKYWSMPTGKERDDLTWLIDRR